MSSPVPLFNQCFCAGDIHRPNLRYWPHWGRALQPKVCISIFLLGNTLNLISPSAPADEFSALTFQPGLPYLFQGTFCLKKTGAILVKMWAENSPAGAEGSFEFNSKFTLEMLWMLVSEKNEMETRGKSEKEEFSKETLFSLQPL